MNLNKISFFSFKTLALVGLFIGLTSFTTMVHRFYLSLTEIHVDTKKQTLDISCKIFTDDLQNALEKKYGKKIDLAGATKNKEVQQLVFKYITDNLKINVGGKKEELAFVGFETETDATWCYLEIENFTDKGKVAIMNSLLYDYLSEQSNMINFYWDDIDKSAKLVNPEKLAEFEF